MLFNESCYHVMVLDYNPEFMKLFYNSIDIEKIKSMEIIFYSHANTIDTLDYFNDDSKIILIRYKSSKDYYDEVDCLVLQIDDYI